MVVNDNLIYDLYRCPNNSGGSKDWAIAVDRANNRIGLAWQATGKRMQGKLIGVPGDLNAEKNSRIFRQSKDGYTFVGQCQIVNGFPRMVDQSTGAAPEVVPHVSNIDQKLREKSVFFTLEFERENAEDLLSYLAKTAQPFEAVVRKSKDGVMGSIEIDAWALHIDREQKKRKGNPSRVLFPNDARLPATGAGHVSPGEGIYPVLYLMLLKRNAPKWLTVSLSRSDNIEVTDKLACEQDVLGWFDTKLEHVSDFCVSVGLLPKPIDLSEVVGSNSYFF